MKTDWTALFLFSQERALNYLSSCIDQVHTFGDILQLVIVELIYKVRFSCNFLPKHTRTLQIMEERPSG